MLLLLLAVPEIKPAATYVPLVLLVTPCLIVMVYGKFPVGSVPSGRFINALTEVMSSTPPAAGITGWFDVLVCVASLPLPVWSYHLVM